MLIITTYKNLQSFVVLTILILLGNTDIYSQTQVDVESMEYRCVGPTRGGRVTTVAGVVSQSGTFYMGSTGGGVWKTEDFGTSWKNVSDGYFETPSTGAIRVAPTNSNLIYVGTGTDGFRSNMITGKGVYKSEDAGASWKHIGLRNTGQIGAVEVHPDSENVVFVAAIGQAFNPNPERGVYRTKDGGDNWELILQHSDTVGAVDIEFAPDNPDIMYATMWRAERKPWTIISGSYEDGIFKSEDGGDSWRKLEKGLPKLKGKMDLAVCPTAPDMLYAIVEALGDSAGLYVSEDKGESFTHVPSKKDLANRAFYYTNIDVDPKDPDLIYIMARDYFKSTDRGKSWKSLRPPHGDNHDMWINPDNPQLFIQSNDGGANVTHNGGKTWSTQYNQPTAELYQVEVDDQHPYWLYAGQQDNYTTVSVPSLPNSSHQMGNGALIMNTGGCETGPAVPKPGNPDIVYANCKGRFTVFNKRTGQEKRYEVGAANMYGHNPRDLRFRFQRVSPIHVSPHDPNVIYHTSQFVHKTTDEGKTWEIISPDLTAFEPDKQVISGSPISRDVTGEEFYSTIYAIRESKVGAGVIWVGSNDGPVHVTKDGGKKWKKVTPKKLGKGGRVDCVEPSPHNPAKAYIAVLRYQLGDSKPYIYKTTNYGKKWKLLTDGSNGIPGDYPIRVIREDPNKEGLLYAGTEFGMFVSFDDGESWQSFQQNLPITPITDIKVHENDLVLSTMGRSFWILDNISSLQQDFISSQKGNVHLFKPKDTYRYRYSSRRSRGAIPNYPPSAVIIDYFLPDSTNKLIKMEIFDTAGKLVQSFISKLDTDSSETGTSPERDMNTNFIPSKPNGLLKSTQGLNRFRWNMRHAGGADDIGSKQINSGPLVSPGRYVVKLEVNGVVQQQSFELLIDPKVEKSGVSVADLKQQERLNLQILELVTTAKQMAAWLKKERESLEEKAEEKKLDADSLVKLGNIQKLERELVIKKGRYEKPMLLNQIEYLSSISGQADQAPGKDVQDRYTVLKAELTAFKEKYKAFRGVEER